MSFKVGDHVSIIEDTREGIVIEVLPFGVYLIEIDGFDWEFKEKELVLTGKQGDYKINDSEVSAKVNSDKVAQQDVQLKRKFKSRTCMKRVSSGFKT